MRSLAQAILQDKKQARVKKWIDPERSPNLTIGPVIAQSEVLANFLQETGEKCGEHLAKHFADFRPSISRKHGRKKFHGKSSTFSTVHLGVVLPHLLVVEKFPRFYPIKTD